MAALIYYTDICNFLIFHSSLVGFAPDCIVNKNLSLAANVAAPYHLNRPTYSLTYLQFIFWYSKVFTEGLEPVKVGVRVLLKLSL